MQLVPQKFWKFYGKLLLVITIIATCSSVGVSIPGLTEAL